MATHDTGRLLLRQFTNPLVLLLLVAVLLSALLGDTTDSVIVLVILILTGLTGFWQEYRAGRAMDRLRQMIATRHEVVREGQRMRLSTEDVRPGDLVLLDAGDLVPADARIVESNELHVNESSLTGESYPVEKSSLSVDDSLPLARRSDRVWQGTSVVSGTASVEVTAVGGDTVFGGISKSLGTVVETAYEKGMRNFGLFLLRITLVLCAFILVANLYVEKPLLDAVLFSLALAVGMAPELLPAILSISMTAGAKRMMQRKVIVKRLSAMFGFGEVDILCTDKTGTITQGAARLQAVTDMEGLPDAGLARLAWLNASLQEGFANPIDEAIRAQTLDADGWQKVNEVPYDFIRKRLSVAVRKGDTTLMVTKGAMMQVMEACSGARVSATEEVGLDEGRRAAVLERYAAYGREGYRVLGLAVKQLADGRIRREDESGMTLAGFILIEDPLKEDVHASLEELERIGVAVKIVTGDNRHAAAHVAGQLRLMEPGILTGAEIDRMSPEALVVKAQSTDIFAEIEPHQKERIVKALQGSGHCVAYMGDGINDVSAIHAADVGISTENATDVARDAADFVLLEKGLSVLADGIREGRRAFANAMKYIYITTGATFGNMFSVAGAAVLLPFLPMLPKQILLNNLVSDLPFLSIASDRVEDEQLRRPRRWDLPLIRRFMVVFGIHSSLFDMATFGLLYLHWRLDATAFRTGWFIESTLTEIIILFVIRTRGSVWRSRPGKWLLLAAASACLLAILLPASPLAPALGFTRPDARLLLGLAAILAAYTVTADLLKVFFFRRMASSEENRRPPA